MNLCELTLRSTIYGKVKITGETAKTFNNSDIDDYKILKSLDKMKLSNAKMEIIPPYVESEIDNYPF